MRLNEFVRLRSNHLDMNKIDFSKKFYYIVLVITSDIGEVMEQEVSVRFVGYDHVIAVEEYGDGITVSLMHSLANKNDGQVRCIMLYRVELSKLQSLYQDASVTGMEHTIVSGALSMIANRKYTQQHQNEQDFMDTLIFTLPDWVDMIGNVNITNMNDYVSNTIFANCDPATKQALVAAAASDDFFSFRKSEPVAAYIKAHTASIDS